MIRWRFKALPAVVILWVNCLPATAQQQTDTLESTVQALSAQVQELTATIRELKAELQELRIAREAAAPALPAKIEEEQQLLSAKVDEQYQTKVESASKYRVRLSGIVLLNLFNNRGTVDSPDFPSLVRQPRSVDLTSTFGASLRQSMIGFEIFGPDIKGARVDAEAQFDFAGAPVASLYENPLGLMRLRTGVVRMSWPKTTLTAGQDVPFFSPLSPTSVASLALPAFSYSGNLWTWQPQVRLEHRLDMSSDTRIVVQGGIVQPLWSHQPAYAARVAWNRRRLTIGTGSYYSHQEWAFHRNVDAWAATTDWIIPLTQRFDLSGEFYRGRAIGQLGGGVEQTIVTNGEFSDPTTRVRGVNSTGGWAQLKFRQTERVEWNAAVGQDNPFARDFRLFPPVQQSGGETAVVRNRSAMLNFIYRPRSDVVVSGEYQRIRTSWLVPNSRFASRFSLNMGVLF